MLSYLYDFVTVTVTALYRSLIGNPKIEYKKNTISKKLRANVWRTHVGETFIGECYACGKMIEFTDGWHCSHVVAESKGGATILDNLRPCCRHCNLSMGNQNLYAYIAHKGLNGRGKKCLKGYFLSHPGEKNDVRTNNYARNQ